MRRFGKILIILLLLATAKTATALDITFPDGSVYRNVNPTAQDILKLDPGHKILTLQVLQSNYDSLKTYLDSLSKSDPNYKSVQNDLAALQSARDQLQSGSVDIPYDPTGGNTPTDGLDIKCGWTDWECWPLLIIANVGRLVVAGLGYTLTNIANVFFNLSVHVSVRSFNDYANSPGVKDAWRLCRDLVNVAFIFVLLYVAIGTILQLDSVNGKKILSRVIIAAFLVNFSFFFTGIMIDASNVVANEFYSQAAQGHGTLMGAPDIVTPLVQAGTPNLIDKSWNAVADSGGAGGWFNRLGSIIGSYFGQIVLMLVTTTVLLAGGVMFFARTVILIFILVSSPVAFLAIAVGGKQLEKISSKWTSALANQLIFAPVYLLLIYMTIRIISVGGADGSGLRSLVDAGTGGGFLTALIVFTIINGFMLGSLMVAKELGVAGAAGATKFAGGLTGYTAKVLGRTTTGGIRGFGKTAGDLYRGAAQALTAKDQAGVAASRLGGLRMMALSPFTGTGAGAAKSGLEAIRSGRGMVRTVQEAWKKPGQALNEAVSSATGINILGRTKEDERKLKDLEKKEKEEEDRQKSETNKKQAQEIAGKIADGKIKDGSTEEAEAEKTIKGMAIKDVVALDPKTMVTLAHLFSNEQITAIGRKEDFAQDKKEEVLSARAVPFARELERSTLGALGAGKFASNSAMQKALRLMNPDRLGKFISGLDKANPNYENQLRMIAKNINKGWINEMTKNGNLDFDVATRIELMI